MEASGVVFRSIPGLSGAGADAHSRSSYCGFSVAGVRRFNRRELRLLGPGNSIRTEPSGSLLSSGFYDNAHLQYYNDSPAHPAAIRCGSARKETTKTAKKMIKKRLKLLRGLSGGLSMFPDIGSGLEDQQLRRKMISETTEMLMGQLQQLKAEEKELKRKKKEEKAKMKNRASSSSSSSESSDSECGEVMEMSRLKTQTLKPPSIPQESTTTLQRKCPNNLQAFDEEATRALEMDGGRSVEKKIEVCTGGKCKRSGAAALLEEFQRVLGNESAAVGCKCMGKCRDGPNVRVLNHSDGIQAQIVDNSVRAPANPLCIGVGLEDVSTIVANFLGETPKEGVVAISSS